MKAVFFDFDGTLTYKGPNIWKSIWQKLGYDVNDGSEYKRQLNAFLNGEISYSEWTAQTLEKYIERNMRSSILTDLSKSVKLIDGAVDTFKILKENGFSLHILSGNVTEVIKQVLGENVKYFDSVNANNFVFNESGELTNIIPTEFDFEGKANFIKNYKLKYQAVSDNEECELYFIGNGINDEFAYSAGCKTILVNPHKNVDLNTTKWNYIIMNMSSLTEILKYIKGVNENN